MNIGPKGGLRNTLPAQTPQSVQGSSADDKVESPDDELAEEALVEEALNEAYGAQDDQFSTSKYGLYGGPTKGSQSLKPNDLLSILKSNPAVVNELLQGLYYSGSSPQYPGLSRDHEPPDVTPQNSYNLTQINDALDTLSGLQDPNGEDFDSDTYPSLSDYVNYSALPYAAQQLDPKSQRLLYAQMLGKQTAANAPEPSESQATSATQTAAAASSAAPDPSAAMVQKAQDDFYKENNPYRALATLQAAIQKYPDLVKTTPDVLYWASLYAFSSADIPAAKQYLAQAKTALAGIDPSSDYAKYYNNAMDSLSSQINTFNLSNWSSDKIRQGLASMFGNTPATQQVAQELGRGLSNWWVPTKTLARGSRSFWEKSADASYRSDRGGVATRGGAQKGELARLDAATDAAEQSVKQAQKELAAAKGDDKGPAQAKLEEAQKELKSVSEERSQFVSAVKSDPETADKMAAASSAVEEAKVAAQTAQEKLDAATKSKKDTTTLDTEAQTAKANLEKAQTEKATIAKNVQTKEPPAIPEQPGDIELQPMGGSKKSGVDSSAEKSAAAKSGGAQAEGEVAPAKGGISSAAAEEGLPAAKTAATGGAAAEEGGIKTNVGTADVAPGWWGMGTTLNHAQAAAFQWSLGQGDDGKVKSDWRGPFATTSNVDPTQQQVVIAQGGEGDGKYQVSANAGMNLLNAEARTYDMVYGGGSAQAGNMGAVGVGGMVGAQARADLMDVNAGINYTGGETTIGNTKIDNLVTASASGQASIGVQGDAHAGFAIGPEQSNIGIGIGGFAGAQAAGMVGASVDGIGVNVIGQAWAGAGIKANADISYSHGKLTFNVGLGAALEYGGYVDLAVTIDFNQIADEIKGIGESGVNLAKEWGKDVPVLGDIAGFGVGVAEGVGKLALNTADSIGKIGDRVGDMMVNSGKLAPFLAVPGEVLKQGSEMLSAPKEIIDESQKPSSQAFADARKSFSQGSIVSGIAQGVGGSIKWVGEGLISLFGGQKPKQ